MLYMELPSTHTEAVAVNVRRLLREAGIAQRTVADATGIPLTTLVRRLGGKSPFNVNELAAIADLLGATIPELVDTEKAA